jgi:hypothetical protein
MIWDRLGLSREGWLDLAAAFYALAHGDSGSFLALPEELQEHPAGRLCARYMETGELEDLNHAGYAITHTRHWYVYLGRTF